MIKKFTLAALLIGSAGFSTYGQDQITVNWGPEIKDPSKTATTRIIGADRDGFYTLRTSFGFFNNDNPPALERCDSKNTLTYSKGLVIPLPPKTKANFESQDIRYLRGQLVLFSSHLNKDTDTYYSFANKVMPDGTVSGEMVELGRMEGIKNRRDILTADYNFVLSTDSSKILVFQHHPYEKNKPGRFDMKVVDHNLQAIYTKKVELPFTGKEIAIKKYLVDNEGNTFVLMAVDKPKAEQKSSKTQKYFYKILAYFHKEDQMKEYDLTLSDKFTTDASFILDGEQNLLVGGFYADSKKMSTGGTYMLKIDSKSKKVLKGATKEFTPEFLTNFMSERKANKEDAGIKHMEMKQMLLRPDGSVVMAAEQEWVEIQHVNNGKTSYTVYHYYNNDIILVNINPTGDISWVSHVPKKQHTRNDYGMYNSFAMLIDKNNQMRLVFNDNPKNVAITDHKKYKEVNNGNKALTTLVTLTPDGTVQRTPLFPAKESKTIIRPSFYLKGNNSMIIYGQKGKVSRFGRLSFS